MAVQICVKRAVFLLLALSEDVSWMNVENIRATSSGFLTQTGLLSYRDLLKS